MIQVYSLIKGYWSPLNPKLYRSLKGTLKDPFKGTPRYSLIKGFWRVLGVFGSQKSQFQRCNLHNYPMGPQGEGSTMQQKVGASRAGIAIIPKVPYILPLWNQVPKDHPCHGLRGPNSIVVYIEPLGQGRVQGWSTLTLRLKMAQKPYIIWSFKPKGLKI